MDPEVEDHYMKLLSEWKKDEDNIKDQLDEIMKKLDALAPAKEVPDKGMIWKKWWHHIWIAGGFYLWETAPIVINIPAVIETNQLLEKALRGLCIKMMKYNWFWKDFKFRVII